MSAVFHPGYQFVTAAAKKNGIASDAVVTTGDSQFMTGPMGRRPYAADDTAVS